MAPPVLRLTDNAARYIQSVLAAKEASVSGDAGDAPVGLRISVKKGGCSGSEYDFQYASAKQPHDEELLDKGVRVFIDPAATLKILGSEMDYEDNKFSSGLVFRNPNEMGRCGCGKSVQL